MTSISRALYKFQSFSLQLRKKARLNHVKRVNFIDVIPISQF